VRPQDWFRLTALAAIWGASFLFFRILAPALGIFFTAGSRVAIAGAALTLWLIVIRANTHWKTHPTELAVIGVLNSAIPFALFAYAALHIPAAYSAILNAFTPIFGFVAGVIWLGERMSSVRAAGLALGVAGVALVANPWQRASGFTPDAHFLTAVGACLLSTFCYAASGIYVKKRAAGISSKAIAAGSQVSACGALLPFAFAYAPGAAKFSPGIVAAMLVLALVCSALAYILYFRLMQDVGPSRTLIVTLLIPLFGMLWGTLFRRTFLALRAEWLRAYFGRHVTVGAQIKPKPIFNKRGF
jgi:drug/metabolite transporter (DMT)-like permease